MICLMHFLEGQGYKVDRSLLRMQDNERAIKIEKNGKQSGCKRTRHMDILRYFYIEDRLKTEDIEVIYCPTESMLADYFTKPLHGDTIQQVTGRDHGLHDS